jgi:hypothetical protein
MALIIALFILVNIAFVCPIAYSVRYHSADQTQKLCVVPMEVVLAPENATKDMGTLFFYSLFGKDSAVRVMQAMIALSIFGNRKNRFPVIDES